MKETRKKMLLIANPVSGKQLATQYMLRMIDLFDKAGYAVTACCTKKNENAYAIVKKRAVEFDIVVCCGGDGTLKETVCGVSEIEKDVPIGYIPMGTTMDFATSMKIPKDILKAAELVVTGEPRPIDLGTFGKEHFIYVAGFGNFTAVSYEVNQALKNKIGIHAYYVRAVKDFFQMHKYHAKVYADGEIIEGDYFYGAVSNSYSVAGMPVMHNLGVEFDDGKHELVLVRMFKTPAEFFELARDLMRNDVTNNSLITVRHCKNIKFTFPQPTPFTLDGEYGGSFREVKASVIKHAVRIIAPKQEEI